MRIAYIIPSLDSKGPIFVVNYLVKYLVQDNSIDVFYFNDIHDREKEMRFDCSTHKINLTKAINFDNYDIIHSHCLIPDLYIFLWKKKIRRAIVITTLHQDTYRSFAFRYNKLIAKFLTTTWLYIQKEFDQIVSISNQLKELYNKKLRNKITTIYNGCEIESLEEAYLNQDILNSILELKEKGYKVIATYAFITKGKGINQVIKVLSELKDFAFVIIGDGTEIYNLKNLTEELDLSNRVLFFTACKAPYLYLENVDIYIMPSYSEGFGLSMIEAALKKQSIVCSNIDSFHEIFTEEEATFFDLDNLSSLKKALIEAYERRYEKAEKGYNKAYSCFRSEIMAANHFHFYNKLITIKN